MKLSDARLNVSSDFGSVFVLNTQGDSIEEALTNAVITELDREGKTVSICCAPECPNAIYKLARDIIIRVWDK